MKFYSGFAKFSINQRKSLMIKGKGKDPPWQGGGGPGGQMIIAFIEKMKAQQNSGQG